MILINYMWCYNQLHLRMIIKILNEKILIWSPGTSGHKSKCAILELFHQRQLLGLLTNLQNTVKTRISHYRNPCNSNLGKETLRCFVLHKQVIKILQHISVSTSIPLKEYLIFTENGRNTIHGDTTQNSYLMKKAIQGFTISRNFFTLRGLSNGK